jgi:energy-coupling factor transporter ATP-binding protein EcfA2
MAPQYVFTMKGVGKIHQPDTVVLKDIWLSFLPGAKIGVLGVNGAGKSTVLKIMAGVDQDFGGEAFPGEGVTRGYLPQEPVLDPTKDVKGNVEEGVAAIKALLARYDEVNEKLGGDMTSSRACRTRSKPPMPGTSTRGSRWPWIRCGSRPLTPTSRRSPAASGAAWRSAACCCSRRTCCFSTSRPTISTRSRSAGSSGS